MEAIKAVNALGTTFTLLPEVVKPRTDKWFVKSSINKSRKSSYFPRGILN